jgi:YVTN family beta-propeller protein
MIRTMQFVVVAVAVTLAAGSGTARAERQFVWVTNSAGNDVHVIDVATQQVVQRIEVGPQPHGIAAPDVPNVVYLSIEHMKEPNGELIWVNPATYKIEHRIQVGPEPNQIACTPDGKWVYVPCNDGKWWVIDGHERKVATKIHTGGRPHNTLASRDGKLMYLSPMGSPQRVLIVSVEKGHHLIGQIPFANITRPPALSSDGRRFYQQIDGLLGFQVADTESRSVIATVRDTIPAAFRDKPSRSHGIAIRPDQKEIWSCNVEHGLVHVHDLTKDDCPEIATIPMMGKVYWLCFTPDSKYAYISVRTGRKVCVVDAQSKKIVTHIDVGDTPKRDLVITLPETATAGG